MFYSHQLLARKAPLGQIWMAATMHAKMNRKRLNKLNIIKICEEILNPSVPMALRLSGILMGGVVIVYERKVRLLYDDVTRLLVEMNESWKVKAAPDPTVLPKGKSQAKKEAVTLPENQETDVGDIEQSLNGSNGTTNMEFQRTAYFAMRLDNVDEPFVHNDPGEEEPFQNFHQADVDNITLSERFDLYQANTNLSNRFERFDIEEDTETQLNCTSGEHTEMPTTLIPSPPPQDEPQRGQDPVMHAILVPGFSCQGTPFIGNVDHLELFKLDLHAKPPTADEIHDQHPEHQVNQQSDESKEARQRGQPRKGPLKRKTRRPAASGMDFEQTIIPGHIYQSWLQNSSDIGSRRGRKRKATTDILSTMKIANLMELPPLILIDDLLKKENREIHYPAPLLELWMKSTKPPHGSPSERTSPPQPPEPSLSSPPEGGKYREPVRSLRHHSLSLLPGKTLEPMIEFLNVKPFEDIPSGVGSQSLDVSVEKLRPHLVNNDNPTENLMERIRAKFLNDGFRANEADVMVTPGTSDDVRSNPSSLSGQGNSEVNSGRTNQKRLYSSSRHSSSGLEPVPEEIPRQHSDANFKLSRLSENGLTPDPELLVETGPTQTQHTIINPPVDKMTNSIRMQMKMHFDTPGAPKVESLHSLASGLNRKAAAMLFYQTCVLASGDCLRVEQMVPYGDIFISRGAKM